MSYTKWFWSGASFLFLFISSTLPLMAQPVNCASMTPPMVNVGGVCVPTTGATGLSSKPVSEIIATVLLWLLGILGFIAILAFIIAGLQYILSTGDENMAETAKRNMTYAIIGLVVALSGWIILLTIDSLLRAVVP